MSLHACDTCLRPLGDAEVCWRRDIMDGKPIMVPMCEDCWQEFVEAPSQLPQEGSG